MFSRSNPAGAPLIVIAGGGIGGLSLALKLHAAGIHEITIVEKSRFINPEVGAGLNVLPSAMNVLSELGLLSAVTGAGVAPSTQTYFTAQGLPICATARGLVLAPSGLPQVAIHRGKLHSILYGAVVERLGKSCMLRGAKVVGYRQVWRLKVELEFILFQSLDILLPLSMLTSQAFGFQRGTAQVPLPKSALMQPSCPG